MRYWIPLCFAVLAGCVSPAAMKINEGVAAANRGDLAAAEQLTREALQLGPDAIDRAAGINNLGTFALRRGDVNEAVRAWTLAARMGDPTAQQNLLNHGAPIPAADLQPQAAAGGGGGLDAALLLFLAGASGGGQCVHQKAGSYGVTSC